jgi:chromosome segregation ATPase
LAASDFQLRSFVREIALSKTYQRSCEEPPREIVNLADIRARLESLKREKEAQQQSIQPMKESLVASRAEFKAVRSEDEQKIADIGRLEKAASDMRQSLDKIAGERKVAEDALAKLRAAYEAVAGATQKLHEVVAQVPTEAPLAEMVTAIRPVGATISNSVAATEKLVSERTAAEQSLTKQVEEAESAVAIAVAARPNIDRLRELEGSQLAAEHRLVEANFITQAIDAQIELANQILGHAALAATEPVKSQTAWAAIVERWTIGGQVAPMKPLTAEQLGISVMQATGMLASQMAAVEAKLEKSPPDALKKAADVEKARMRPRFAQLELLSETRGTLREFIRQYGGQPGEEFQATVNQALYFGNGGVVDGWLKPAGENLLGRLVKIDDAKELADELSWSILSRPASETERQTIADHLKDRSDKAVAIGELAWSLLASTEFRFNH